jgi:hypothetical protein
MNGISLERWQQAQVAEAKYHKDPLDKLLSNYKESYRQYFKWLGIEHNLNGKKIIEIGCANIPALHFCTNYTGVIIEPLPSDILQSLVKDMPVTLIKDPAEYVDLSGYDEVWLFNVLQHVIDPKLLVENMKKIAKCIRYFEPVNMGTCVHHPHGFTMDDFIELFGEANHYPDNPSAVSFHSHECAYGVWSC